MEARHGADWGEEYRQGEERIGESCYSRDGIHAGVYRLEVILYGLDEPDEGAVLDARVVDLRPGETFELELGSRGTRAEDDKAIAVR